MVCKVKSIAIINFLNLNRIFIVIFKKYYSKFLQIGMVKTLHFNATLKKK